MNRALRENQPVKIESDGVLLDGNLQVQPDAEGLVVFVHGSGSSRLSPRNLSVARALQDAGLCTLLFDLLTREEERIDQITRQYRFDIQLLARRTVDALDWLHQLPETQDLYPGCFGASTGAAAALIAAARRSSIVKAVVSRGGRPDLAGSALSQVLAPSLFIVGGLDAGVIELNQQAISQMPPETIKRLEVIPGASHLFEEPGMLEHVIRLARAWFLRYLTSSNKANLEDGILKEEI